jgi:adenylate cyclase
LGVFVVGLGLLVVTQWPLLVLLWQLWHPPLGAPPDYRPPLVLDKPSVAVLPFTVLSDDPRFDYYGDGIMEDLTTDLSKLPGLVVTWFASTHTYKGKVVKASDVSKELGVRYIVQGSVRTVGGRIFITVQLIDGTTGMHVWAERYERPLQDLFTVQEEVRRKILLHLGLKLIPQEEERLQHLYTPSLEAYNFVAHGMELFFRGVTLSDNANEQQFYERAIALDRNYALAYAMLGFARWRQWLRQPVPDPRLLDQIFTLAQQALALDDSLVHGHELLGLVYLYRDRHYEQALAEIKQAISLSPSWFSAYFLLGVTLNAMGRPKETITLVLLR